jgi:Fe-S oxidoreductase
VHFIADFIAANIDRLPKVVRGGAALVQPHCHHHAIIGYGAEQSLLDHLELDVERPRQGCCGMAGAFGMAKETFEVGRKIGERVLLPRVRQLDQQTVILADGFSCREQIEMHGQRKTLHIAELLRERLQA